MFSKKFNIPYALIASAAYIYLLVPIWIFMIGWVKPVFAAVFVALTLIGLVFIIRSLVSKHKTITLSFCSIAVILIVAFAWVYIAGIGGFFPQTVDWYWRNAVLRDLSEYSWPVIYPGTGNRLVYYVNYFLPCSLVGKAFGYMAAQTALFIETWIGVVLALLLLVSILRISDEKKVILVTFAFVTFYGIGSMVGTGFDMLKLVGFYTECYFEFSSNISLLMWVTNQAVISWLAVSLFFENRDISSYVFLGMCTLASAPLPFIGLFLLMVTDGVVQLVKGKKFALWIKNAFSIPNVCAVLSIFVVYLAFFLVNDSMKGNADWDSFGLYICFLEGFFYLKVLYTFVTFLLFSSGIYVLLLFKEKKTDPMFWTIIVSFIIFPLFRFGEGRDLGMRAIIPAQYILMIFALQFLVDDENRPKVRYYLLVSVLIMAVFGAGREVANQVGKARKKTRQEMFTEAIYTLGNKLIYPGYCGGGLHNFLCEDTSNNKVFNTLFKGKTEQQAASDMVITERFLKDNQIPLISGDYFVTNKKYGQSYISVDEDGLTMSSDKKVITLSNTTVHPKYELHNIPDKLLLKVNDDLTMEGIARVGAQNWGQNWVGENQLIQLNEVDGYYRIVWNNDYYLTCSETGLTWEPMSDSDAQLWKISE